MCSYDCDRCRFDAVSFRQRFDLVILELDDPPLAFVGLANEGGKQNVSGLEY